MSDHFEDKLKNIFVVQETIEYIKNDIAIFLLSDLSNIVVSYLNSESTVIKVMNLLKFKILNYELTLLKPLMVTTK